jgi:SM-20-related protein
MSGAIVVIDEFLPPHTFENLARLISNEPLTYGSRSNFRTDPHGHWSRNFVTAGRLNLADVSGDLEENEEAGPVYSAWKFLRETRLGNDLLIRCYLNGYTYGTDGYFHADSDRPDELTTIVYMNDYWEPDWAGETVFLDKSGEIVKSVLPRANRAVIFPSHTQHAGRSVSRKCMVLRKALIFKSRQRRSTNFEKLSSFLRKVGAMSHAHKAGTLHDHLVRTFSILESKGFDSTVCFGGGLHAVYGTNAFRHCVLTPLDHAKIVDEFGPRAEKLARLFSELDRPRTLESPQDLRSDCAVVELRDGQTVVLERPAFDDLRKIECANQIDQDGLAKYNTLREFWSHVD